LDDFLAMPLSTEAEEAAEDRRLLGVNGGGVDDDEVDIGASKTCQ
jgi:hypothetical protein